MNNVLKLNCPDCGWFGAELGIKWAPEIIGGYFNEHLLSTTNAHDSPQKPSSTVEFSLLRAISAGLYTNFYIIGSNHQRGLNTKQTF